MITEIVVEDVLEAIVDQMPLLIDSNQKEFKVKFEWGGQDDLNLYMQKEVGNKTPLIWLVQGDKDRLDRNDLQRTLTLIIAKDSTHKTSRNPIVWKTEFRQYLNPLLATLKYGLRASNLTQVIEGSETVYKEANYSYNRNESGTVTNTLDFWNVIEYKADVFFYDKSIDCITENIFFNNN